MGISCEFKQVSSYVLGKLKQEPTLFYALRHADRISILEDYYKFGGLLWRDQSEEIELDIYQVLSEGRIEGFSVDKSWHELHYLLTNNSSWEFNNLAFLIDENLNGDNMPLINIVLGGTAIEECETGYGSLRYLISDEVRQVVQAFSKISEEGLRKRYEQAETLKPRLYSCDWGLKHDVEDFLELYDAVVEYYQDAAIKEDAMLIYLT